MTWITDIHTLDVGMEAEEIVYGDEREFYLTIPAAGGAIELDEQRQFWFRLWGRDHGILREEELITVPEGPLEEQAAFIRMYVLRETHRRDRFDQQDRINDAVKMAIINNQEIDHATARAIAIGSYDTNTADFAGNGRINSDFIWFWLFSASIKHGTLSDDERLAADALGSYLLYRRTRGETGSVPGWSDLRI